MYELVTVVLPWFKISTPVISALPFTIGIAGAPVGVPVLSTGIS
nr:hypothetical protein [Campylobacter concisus]